MSPKIPLVYKIASWFLAVRVHYVLLLVCAQYLASAYIFSDDGCGLRAVFLDTRLFLLILSTICSIAAGYILGDYHDMNRDVINYPLRMQMVSLSSPRTKQIVCVLLNIVAIVISFLVSWRVAVFFTAYIGGVWLYSFFLKHLVVIGNLVCVSLMMTPFFVLVLHYKAIQISIIAHAAFLFLLLFLHLCIKDTRNISGDYIHHYYTIANVYGENVARIVIRYVLSLLIVLSMAISVYFEVGLMVYYFYFCALLLSALLCLSFILKQCQYTYKWSHYAVKFVIVLGVLSIALYHKPS